MSRKTHFKTSNDHDQPACKVVKDTSVLKLTQEPTEVTCDGCINKMWIRGRRNLGPVFVNALAKIL